MISALKKHTQLNLDIFVIFMRTPIYQTANSYFLLTSYIQGLISWQPTSPWYIHAIGIFSMQARLIDIPRYRITPVLSTEPSLWIVSLKDYYVCPNYPNSLLTQEFEEGGGSFLSSVVCVYLWYSTAAAVHMP